MGYGKTLSCCSLFLGPMARSMCKGIVERPQGNKRKRIFFQQVAIVFCFKMDLIASGMSWKSIFPRSSA
jgi:hypothetical protein